MSYASEQGVLNAQYNTEIMRQLPSVLMRPSLSQDGNAWLAIYGDLPTGVVGTGSTPAEAMADFDAAWHRKAVAPPRRNFLSLGKCTPVAEIVSAHGDPEAFGERELLALVDIQKFPYGTKLYAASQPT